MKLREKVTLIIGIIIIIISVLGVIAFYTLPLFIRPPYTLSAPRGIGGGIAGSISSAHSNYLRNGTDYDLDDVLSATAFTSSITYQPTDTDTPAPGEIASNAAGTAIILNCTKGTYKWDYIPLNINDGTPAYLTENSDSFQIYMPDK